MHCEVAHCQTTISILRKSWHTQKSHLCLGPALSSQFFSPSSYRLPFGPELPKASWISWARGSPTQTGNVVRLKQQQKLGQAFAFHFVFCFQSDLGILKAPVGEDKHCYFQMFKVYFLDWHTTLYLKLLFIFECLLKLPLSTQSLTLKWRKVLLCCKVECAAYFGLQTIQTYSVCFLSACGIQ